MPSLHLGASCAAGPWIREGVEDPLAIPGETTPDDRFRTYKQKGIGLESTFTRGMVELRGEYLVNRSSDAPALETELGSIQLWWRFFNSLLKLDPVDAGEPRRHHQECAQDEEDERLPGLVPVPEGGEDEGRAQTQENEGDGQGTLPPGPPAGAPDRAVTGRIRGSGCSPRWPAPIRTGS